VHNYHQYVVAQLKHTLSRRSQKGVISKEKMAKILKHFLVGSAASHMVAVGES
jgi:hypothetical protein